MRAVFGLIVIVYTAVWVWTLSALPERVPLHFTFDGHVDQWGGRTTALTLFALVGTGIATLMGGLSVAASRASLKWFNLPHKAWWRRTPEREKRVRRMLANDLLVIGSLIMTALIIAQLFTVDVARRHTDRVNTVELALAGACLVALLAWALWMSFVRYRPKDDVSPSSADRRSSPE